MIKIFIEKTQKQFNITANLFGGCMRYAYILLIIGVLFLGLSTKAHAQTTFNGELFANFSAPVGATFRLFHQGQLVALNNDGYIDFGELSYNSNVGLWVPSQMCSNPFTYCYRLTVNMEPFGVMGDFDLNVQYVNTNNPNQSAPFNQRHGLGRKVGMTLKRCETLAGSNGTLDCFDMLNLGGPTSNTYAILLDHINGWLGWADTNLPNTTDYFQMEFFVYTFNANPAVWSIGGQPPEAFTDMDHYGDYDGTLTVTATYN